MEEYFTVKPHWICDDNYNDKPYKSIENQIVAKVIQQVVEKGYHSTWHIIAFTTEDEARNFYNENINGRPVQKTYRCFMTSKFMLNQALKEKYTNIEVEYMDKKPHDVATYWCMLLPK